MYLGSQMANTQIDLGELEAQFSHKERRIFGRTLLMSLVPVGAAAVLLWTTIAQISAARDELENLKVTFSDLDAKAGRARDELAVLQDQYQESQNTIRTLELDLARVQEKLRLSSQFARHIYEFNWAEAKSIASQFPEGGDLLSRIGEYRLRGVGWDLRNTPSAGFVSPAFAGTILQDLGVVGSDQSPVAALSNLPFVTDEPPNLGDVVIYDAGFAMFYFRDRDGVEFVVGMTLVGIVALKYDFGVKRIGVRRSGFSR